MEQTLEPESTLLSVFPHEVCSERYCTHIVGILHSGSLCAIIESILVLWFWYVACEQGTVLQYSLVPCGNSITFLKG